MSRSIQKMYTRIDRGYETVNHLYSLYMDVAWRKKAARLAALEGLAESRSDVEKAGEKTRWLDLCTGTGEMVSQLRKLSDPETCVVGADFSLPMLHVARAKGLSEEGINFVSAEASTLPFASESFDLVTISFATRNLEAHKPLPEFFREIRRILRPGGRFVHLETSQPPNKTINFLFRTYVRATVVPLGKLVTNAPGPYKFLRNSVIQFHNREELTDLFKEAGFSRVETHPIMFGAVAIHEAFR